MEMNPMVGFLKGIGVGDNDDKEAKEETTPKFNLSNDIEDLRYYLAKEKKRRIKAEYRIDLLSKHKEMATDLINMLNDICERLYCINEYWATELAGEIEDNLETLSEKYQEEKDDD